MVKAVKKTVTILVLASFLASALLPLTALADYEVHPEQDVSTFITYQPRSFGPGNKTLVFPPTFQIRYEGVYDKVVHGWWCPAWWDPNCDPANYRYKVVKKEYQYRNPNLPQVINVSGARILLTYFTSLSVVPYASKTWWGYMEEHVKTMVTVYIYGRVDKPPTEPTKIDLGKAIASALGSSTIYLDYDVEVERTKPSPALYDIRDTFDLLLTNLELSFYRLRVTDMWTYVTGGVALGSYSKKGYLLIAPVGSITVSMCLDGPPGEYVLNGELEYYNMYNSTKTGVSLMTGTCRMFTLDNAVLIPGNYTGNSSLTVTFKSGAFSININGNTTVNGALLSASLPYVMLEPVEKNGNYTWYAHIYVGVNYQSFNYYDPGVVKVNGAVYIQGIKKKVGCPEQYFFNPGTYTCDYDLGSVPYSVNEVSEATANLTVTISLLGTTESDEATVKCAIVSPSSAHGVVLMIYSAMQYVALAFILASVVIYALSAITVAFGVGRPVIDPMMGLQLLMFAAVFAVILFGLPYVYWFVLKILYSFPEFSSVLSETPLSNPDQLLSMKPAEALSMLYSYYDMTIDKLKMDYRVWVETELQVNLGARIIAVGVLLMGLFALALVLMISMNSPVAGSLMLPIASFALSIIGMLIILLPTLGIVQALIALAEFIIVASAVLLLVVFILGATFALVPVSSLTRYAEDMMGAGVVYLLGVPTFGPIIYAVYEFTMNQLSHYIGQAEGVFKPIQLVLGPLQLLFVPPIGTFMRVTGYVTMASLTTLMIILLHAYMLTRTGVMGAIGEGIMRVARR